MRDISLEYKTRLVAYIAMSNSRQACEFQLYRHPKDKQPTSFV